MPIDWGVTGLNMGVNAVNGIVQQARSKNLMGLQLQNQKDLNDYNQQLDVKTWEQTSYPAQMKMMKQAGLNPALMYSKGAGNSGTTGNLGGSAAMASAPVTPPIDLQAAIQAKTAEKQQKLIEEQTREQKAKADAAEKAAVPQAEANVEQTNATIANLKATTTNTEAKTELTKVETALNQIESANRQGQITAQVENVIASTQKLIAEKQLTQGNMQNIINETAAKVIGQTLNNELTVWKETLTKTEIYQLEQSIDQKWQELNNKQVELTQKDKEIEIEKFKAEITAKYPGAMNTVGMVLNKAYSSLEGLVTWTVPTEAKVPIEKR